MTHRLFNRTSSRGLASTRTLVFLLIVAVLVPVAVVAQEAWNGLVKTDMALIGATRDVS